MSDSKNPETKKSRRSAVVVAVVFVILFAAASLGYATLSQQVAIDNARINFSNNSENASDNAGASRDDSNASKSPEKTSEQQKAPDFTVIDANGSEVSLGSLFGQPIVLNFWASTCGPCQKEMPDFQAAYEKHGSEVRFVMVNLTSFKGESVDHAKEYLAQNGYTLPVYFDVDDSAMASYGITSIPRTFLIGPDGNIAASATGAINENALAEGIEQLLAL